MPCELGQMLLHRHVVCLSTLLQHCCAPISFVCVPLLMHVRVICVLLYSWTSALGLHHLGVVTESFGRCVIVGTSVHCARAFCSAHRTPILHYYYYYYYYYY